MPLIKPMLSLLVKKKTQDVLDAQELWNGLHLFD